MNFTIIQLTNYLRRNNLQKIFHTLRESVKSIEGKKYFIFRLFYCYYDSYNSSNLIKYKNRLVKQLQYKTKRVRLFICG